MTHVVTSRTRSYVGCERASPRASSRASSVAATATATATARRDHACVRASKRASERRRAREMGRSKRMTRMMTLCAPCDVTSVVCARHRVRHWSALPPPPQPPPSPLACVAPRAPKRDRPRPMSRSTRGGLEPHLGDPEGESNPQRRRKFGDGHQARKNKYSCSKQVTHTRMREATHTQQTHARSWNFHRRL